MSFSHPFESHIRNVENFPKEGVIFKDVGPLLQERFHEVIQSMGQNLDWSQIDYIVGIESRGFILGAGMAQLYNKGFIPMRKKGKLPPPVLSESYSLEYGTDTLELAQRSKQGRVVIVDDVLATGGTLGAAMNLCMKNNLEVQALSVLINLTFLNKFNEQKTPLHSVLNY